MSGADDIQIPAGYKLVPDADHQTLLNSYNLLNKLWDDPKHGTALKRAAKEVNPALRIPEIDVAEPLLAPIREEMEAFKKTHDELRAENLKIREERDEERALDKLSRGIEAAQKKYRLTADGRTEMLEIMKRGEASTPESAAALIVANLEPAKPVTGTNFGPMEANVLNMDGRSQDESDKLLHTDPMKWLDSEVPRILNEMDAEAA